MLEFQILTDILGMLARIPGDRFEYGNNLYSKAAIEARQKELFKEFIESYMIAQEAEVITEESD